MSSRDLRDGGWGRRTIGEAIGAYFLVLVGPGAAMVNEWSGGAVTHVGVALAFAFVVIGMIYALGHLTGAHINPAVTSASGRFGVFRVPSCCLTSSRNAQAQWRRRSRCTGFFRRVTPRTRRFR